MTTPRHLAALTRDTLALWVRWFPLLGAWFLAGWTIRTITTHLSVLLGGRAVEPARHAHDRDDEQRDRDRRRPRHDVAPPRGGLGGFDGRVEGVGGNIHALTLTAAGVRAEGENYPATGDGRAQPSTNCRAGWIE